VVISFVQSYDHILKRCERFVYCESFLLLQTFYFALTDLLRTRQIDKNEVYVSTLDLVDTMRAWAAIVEFSFGYSAILHWFGNQHLDSLQIFDGKFLLPPLALVCHQLFYWIRRYEQISNSFNVNLIAGHFNLISLPKNHFGCSLNDSTWTSHGVCFAWTCLSVCEYTYVKAVQERLHDLLDFLKHRVRSVTVTEYAVELKLFSIEDDLLLALVRNQVFNFRIVTFVFL
jgi:hypothetical protein